MTETAVIAPIVKSVHVACSPEHAFEVFTREIGSWWPLETHALHPGEVREVVWEERVGGEVYEVSVDGKRAHWATVLEWAAADGTNDRLARRTRGHGSDGGGGALRRGGRGNARRPRAQVLGATRRDLSAPRERATPAREGGQWFSPALLPGPPRGPRQTPTSIGPPVGRSRRDHGRARGRRPGTNVSSASSSSASAHQRSSKTYSAFSCSQEWRGCGVKAGARTRW